MWKDRIQNLFRYRKINPSPALWEQLESQLAAHEAQQSQHKRRRVWYYAIAASLLLCLGIGYVLQQLAVEKEFQPQEAVAVTTEREKVLPADTTFTPTVIAETPTVPIAPKSFTASPALKSPVASPAFFDINEVDSLFAEYSANAIESRITKEIEKQMTADLQELSPEDLALVATTQAQLNQYVTQKYEQDATFNNIERDLLRNRVKLLAGKLLKEVGTRVVLNNKN
ncbi:hypothetical protein RCZ04_05280 [Capnocytophaga sp. HP1101]